MARTNFQMDNSSFSGTTHLLSPIRRPATLGLLLQEWYGIVLIFSLMHAGQVPCQHAQVGLDDHRLPPESSKRPTNSLLQTTKRRLHIIAPRIPCFPVMTVILARQDHALKRRLGTHHTTRVLLRVQKRSATVNLNLPRVFVRQIGRIGANITKPTLDSLNEARELLRITNRRISQRVREDALGVSVDQGVEFEPVPGSYAFSVRGSPPTSLVPVDR